jgi:uncharacterized protein YeaO (DUF488 family)
MGVLLVKRIYEPVDKADGVRILVDRLWPRGMTKERAHLDQWMKDIAPSTDLRIWFNHDPENWEEFEAKYASELKQNAAVKEMLELVKKNDAVTLLYAAHNQERNHAIVLKRFISHYTK